MSSKSQGSHEEWNSIWSQQSSEKLLNPMYAQKETQNIYQFWQKAYAEDLLRYIKGLNFKTFCELGAGRGTTTMYLARAGFTDLTMVDLAKKGFEIARHSFKHYDLPIPTFHVSNVEQTTLADNSFDCIYNIGLLEHFDDPKPTLKETYRLLKTGGRIFMPIVPKMPWYKSFAPRMLLNPISIIKIIAKRILKPNNSNGSVNRTSHNRDFYKHICKELGFKNVECYPYNPYWKINNKLSNERSITLPVYKWYLKKFKEDKVLRLKTSSAFECCYLLIGQK